MGRKKRTKKMGPAGGFGIRYGLSVRKKYNKIISNMRSDHECPKCGLRKVRRESVGIWNCRKCGFRFTGGSYVPSSKIANTAERVTRKASLN
jgi:large subunit ribosomal protein L37Ae